MKTKLFFSVLILSAYCLLASAYCLADVPSLLNYQGVLKDSLQVPYHGNATMVFSIWDDCSGGNKLWEETQAIVSVSHGLFNVLLGEFVPIPASVFDGANRCLQVIANGNLLSPRRQIVSVGYAFHSKFADTSGYALSAPPDDDWQTDTSGYNIFRMTGNVGIGTTSPGAEPSPGKLEIYQSDSTADFTGLTIRHYGQLYNTDWHANLKFAPGGYNGYHAAKAMIRATVSGGNSGAGRLSFWTSETPPDPPYTRENLKQRMVISSPGDVGIGAMDYPAYKLDVAGEAHATSFPTSSDTRFKTNVTQLTDVLEKLEKIRGVSFDWNELYESLGRSSGHREIGVIAQEVEAVFPELVTTWGDEKYRAVDYGRLSAVLIEAIKELKSENDALKQRIESLEDK